MTSMEALVLEGQESQRRRNRLPRKVVAALLALAELDADDYHAVIRAKDLADEALEDIGIEP